MNAEKERSLQRFVEETRDAYEPSAEARARVHWAVSKKLERKSKTSKGIRYLALALFFSGVAYAFIALRSGSAKTPRNDVNKPRASQVAVVPTNSNGHDVPEARKEELPGVGFERRNEPAKSDAAGTRKSRSNDTKEVRSESLREELEALKESQRLLRAGQASQALDVLENFKRSHRFSALAEERGAATIVALCGVGRVSEARAALARFERTFPKSPQLNRLRATCAFP